MTYQEILDAYLGKRVEQGSDGSGLFEWEDEAEEGFPHDWDALREEFIAEHRKEYLAELISEYGAEADEDDENSEDSDSDYDPEDDYDEEDLLDRFDFLVWVSDETGWSMEELDYGSRGVLYRLSASYETDENGYLTRISDITKEALRGEDACRCTYEAVKPDAGDYDYLEDQLKMLITDDPWYGDDGEDADPVDWEEFDGYPFAAEVVNGEIISMTEDFQQEVLAKLLADLEVSEDELAEFLSLLNDGDEPDDDRFSLLEGCEYDFLAEILGYDESEGTFNPQGIGFLESAYGFETIDLLKALGFPVEDEIEPGPHGHGTDGVVFVE